MDDNFLSKTHIMSLGAYAKNLAEKVIKTNVKSTRKFDPSDPLLMHFRNAESHFLRQLRARPGGALNNAQIESIDVVYNEELQKRFDSTKFKYVHVLNR